MVSIFVFILATNSGPCEVINNGHEANVKLLKYPYPYSAALTVASDTHKRDLAVESFEATHILINSEAKIMRGSENWKLLFDDPEIDNFERWREGIDGFGLPIADSMYLYQKKIGIFALYDEEKGEPVPHYHEGQDLREIIDRWLRLGWVDTLHTPGPGHIPRAATVAGLKWLQERPYRHLLVYTNHSLTKTPACIEPDQAALPLVIKNIIKCGTMALCWVGLEPIARKIAANPYPKPYAQGDNPDSQYYHADLLRQFGFRYYWMIMAMPDYQTHIPDTLILPERSYNGRPSFLRIVALDDGSKCLTFGRCYKGQGGRKSLELLTKHELDKLCDMWGTGIIYTHWAVSPKEVFTAEALQGLTLLRRYYDSGRIWVGPTSKILHFTFVRAYLEYEVRLADGKRIIDIVHIRNPIGEPFVPTVDDLRGISFECSAKESVEIMIAGNALEKNKTEFLYLDDRLIIKFPL